MIGAPTRMESRWAAPVWRQGVATTGVQDIVNVTGLNRSSLYATFGGKQELYRAALERYVQDRSRPVLARLEKDERGLPAVTDFFAGLIETRCTGEFARWGCMISNAHAGTENGDPAVRALLDRQHQRLRTALHAAHLSAQRQRQLAEEVDPDSVADVLALLAHHVKPALPHRSGRPTAPQNRRIGDRHRGSQSVTAVSAVAGPTAPVGASAGSGNGRERHCGRPTIRVAPLVVVIGGPAGGQPVAGRLWAT